MTAFPVDDVTIGALRAACECDEVDGRSHLNEFLDFGIDTSEVVEYCDDGTPVHRGGWSPHSVIVALCDEVERLRDLRDLRRHVEQWGGGVFNDDDGGEVTG